MELYTCRRCGYKTEHKSNLKRHLQKQTPCFHILENIPVETLLLSLDKQYNDTAHVCQECGKKFNTKSSMYRHQGSCKKRDTDLKTKILILEEEMKHLKESIVTTQVNNNNTQNNIQINVGGSGVKVRDFGCENMEALPTELLESLFLDLKFRDLLESLHCDPNYPENHNVRIKSTKRELLEIYRNNKWDIMTFVNGLNELLLQGQRIFKDYYRKNRDKILEDDMEETDLREILSQLDAIERLNEDDIKPIRKELQLMLESQRHILTDLRVCETIEKQINL